MSKSTQFKKVSLILAMAGLGLAICSPSQAQDLVPNDQNAQKEEQALLDILNRIQDNAVRFIQFFSGDSKFGVLATPNPGSPNYVSPITPPKEASVGTPGLAISKIVYNLMDQYNTENNKDSISDIRSAVTGMLSLPGNDNLSVGNNEKGARAKAYSIADQFVSQLGLTNSYSYPTGQQNLIIKPTNTSGENNEKDNALSFENFFSPVAYDGSTNGNSSNQSAGSSSSALNQPSLDNANQQEQAHNFIAFISNAMAPLIGYSNEEFNNSSEFTATGDDAPYEQMKRYQYINNLRQYAAFQSIGLSNLRKMYQVRTQKNAGQTDSGSSQPSAPVSQLSFEQKMAEHRLDPNLRIETGQTDANGNARTGTWHDAMEVAKPQTIARETLYVLAEINYQLFQMRRMQERMLATQSANLMITNNMALRSNINPPEQGNPNAGTSGN